MTSPFRRWQNAYMFTLPAILFVAVFMVYPILNMVYLSFSDYSPLRSAVPHFIGLDNYTSVINSGSVLQSLGVTLQFTILSVCLELIGGLAIAMLLSNALLHARTRLERFLNKVYYSIFILPFAAPAIAAAVAWKMLLHPQFGPVNALFGLNVAWFSDYPLLSISVVDTWKMLPFILFLLLAAIMSIEPDQYEAARIDGANVWKEFQYITFPSILPVLVVAGAFRAVDAFTKVFDIVYMTTGGGPDNATKVFPLLVWETAFSHLRFGEASALVSSRY